MLNRIAAPTQPAHCLVIPAWPGGQTGADLVTSSGAGRLDCRRWQEPQSAGTELLLPPGGKGCRAATQRSKGHRLPRSLLPWPRVPALLPGLVGQSRHHGRGGRHELVEPSEAQVHTRPEPHCAPAGRTPAPPQTARHRRLQPLWPGHWPGTPATQLPCGMLRVTGCGCPVWWPSREQGPRKGRNRVPGPGGTRARLLGVRPSAGAAPVWLCLRSEPAFCPYVARR